MSHELYTIRLHGQGRLILAAAVAIVLAALPAPARASDAVAVVAVRRANLRPGPSAEGRPVARANRGDALPVVAEEDGWVLVRLPDGQRGWIRQDLVRLRSVAAARRRRTGRRAARDVPPPPRNARPARAGSSPVTQEYLEARELEGAGWIKLALGGTGIAGGLGFLYVGGLAESAGASGAGILALLGLAGLGGGGWLAYSGWQDIETAGERVRRGRAGFAFPPADRPLPDAPVPVPWVRWSWSF